MALSEAASTPGNPPVAGDALSYTFSLMNEAM